MTTRSDWQFVDEYLAAQPEATRDALEQVRQAIRAALPHAEETISYKMPAYRVDRKVVLWFAGWKHHFSLYPANERLIDAFPGEIAREQLSRGTIRFPLSRPVQPGLIRRIAEFQMREAGAKAARRR